MNNVTVDPLALQCVKIGVIDSIHVRIDSLGQTAQVVPGKNLIGSGPFHAYKKYDLDLALTYIRANIEVGQSQPTPPSSPVRVKKEGKAPEQLRKEIVPVPRNEKEASELIRRFNLNSIERNGVSNILPRDSITKWEFNRPQPLLVARVIAVAKSIGEAKCVSRISTDLFLRNSGCDTLSSWWASSSAEQRWRLLTTRKVSGEAKEGPPINIGRLLEVECPFSDTHLEVETFDDEDEESSYGGVSFASC